MAAFLRHLRPNVQFPRELELTQRANRDLDGALSYASGCWTKGKHRLYSSREIHNRSGRLAYRKGTRYRD